MASWNSDVETTYPVDYRLVHNSFVTMFWRSSLLEETLQWLRSHGYHVIEVDAAPWATAEDMLSSIGSSLNFPDYFVGRSLDAFNDCLSDVASGDYGWPEEATGLVIALRAFDHFAAIDRKAAQIPLDIFADQARRALLIGNRIMCLVQSNDPRLKFAAVGATPVVWNDAEWSDAKRRP